MMSPETPSTGDPSRLPDPGEPFGARPASRGARARRWGAATLVLAAALVGALYFARGDAATEDAMAGHDHSATAAISESEAPVSLSADQAARIGVTYATVTRRALGREVRAVGLVTADESRVQDLSLKVDGWVESLLVNVTGQHVARGAPLLELYSPMLVSAQEELLLAKGLADRLDAADATADSTAREGARALLTSARERLRYWDVPADEIAAIEREGRVRRTITILARGTGHVIEKRVVDGQRVMAGDALFRLADLERVWIEADVYAQDLAAVRVGQRVDVEFEAFPGERRRATVSFLQPTVDAQSRTVRVRAELANDGRRLRPGMYATLRFTSGTGTATLSVPRSAVLETGERALVFVRGDDGALVARAVQLGVRTDEWIELRAGVREGDVVVASATFLIDAESSLRSLGGGSAAAPAAMPGMSMPQP